MIGIEIDLGRLNSFRTGWDAKAKKALVNAFKGEGFRLRRVVQDRFKAGIDPGRAPLTRELAKTRANERRALEWLGQRIGYRVDESGGVIAAVIGPMAFRRVLTPAGFRMHLNPQSIPLLALAKGGSHLTTEEARQWAIYKLRKRWGEPVRKPNETMLDASVRGGARWRKKRAGGHKWREIPKGWIPKANARLLWPQRDWVTLIVMSEQRKSAINVQRLFEIALRGERWAGHWWTDTAGQVLARGELPGGRIL